ncbi:MAG: thioredoxin family protein [Phycisphaerae bacterium]
MVATASTMVSLGTKAPNFALPDTKGNIVSLSDFSTSKALLVIFMCNHCPFVKHVLKEMVALIGEYQKKGLAAVGINSNDVANYPDDSPQLMAKIAKEQGFTFPYLYDETQQIAKSYNAACTPDFFLFDKDKKLVYRGQMDASRPGNNIPVTGSDIKKAIDAVLAGKLPDEKQLPSMGCNIKWKSGN